MDYVTPLRSGCLPRSPRSLTLTTLILIATLGCNQKAPPPEFIDDVLESRVINLSPPWGICGAVVPSNSSLRPSVLINEIYAGSLSDEQDDWFEIHNSGDVAIDLGGWVVEDRFTGDAPKAVPGRFEFPSDTWICPSAFLVIRRESGCELDPLTFDFGLGNTDRLVLTNTSGELVDDQEWLPLPAGQSIGRPDDGPEDLQRLATPTPGIPNSDACECCGECLIGACTLRNGVCEVDSDGACADSVACMQLGWCALKDGRCQATTTDHCRASLLCERTGMCDVRNGVCDVITDADCRASKVCENEGRCTADLVLGLCVATSDVDCAASDDCVHVKDGGTVSRKNRCTLDGNRCVATSCVDSTVCQQLMCCTLAGGKCVGI